MEEDIKRKLELKYIFNTITHTHTHTKTKNNC